MPRLPRSLVLALLLAATASCMEHHATIYWTGPAGEPPPPSDAALIPAPPAPAPAAPSVATPPVRTNPHYASPPARTASPAPPLPPPAPPADSETQVPAITINPPPPSTPRMPAPAPAPSAASEARTAAPAPAAAASPPDAVARAVEPPAAPPPPPAPVTRTASPIAAAAPTEPPPPAPAPVNPPPAHTTVASPPPAQPPTPRVVEAAPPPPTADLPPGTIRILPPAPPPLPMPVASAAPTPSAPEGLVPPSASAATSADGLRVEPADQPVLKVTRNGTPDAGFMRMHEQYVQKAKAGGIDLYLLGDSITDFWQHRHGSDWDKHFAHDRAGDFGISGDRTEHVLWRIDNGELDGLHPKAVVLLIGTNNLASNAVFAADSVDETYAGIKAILDDLRRRVPDAHILLMGVFPREDKPLNGEIDELNKKLPALADGDHIRFLNINAQLTDSAGKLLPGIMLRDRLHPDDKGYDIWAKAMQPILNPWLGK